MVLSVIPFAVVLPVLCLIRVQAIPYDRDAIDEGYRTNCSYKELWYPNMPIDHFSYSDTRTFSLRYLINTDYWDGSNSAPIFFYCGNEGDIWMFADNTGFMCDIAPEFKAMIVFAEHRYYGKTMPFGNQSYAKLANLGKLSSEQALADYAVLLRWLKTSGTYAGAANSPVVAFGGSYGGMLASWFRIKYPHVVVGALASSAPILQFTGVTQCETFPQIVSRTFKNSGKNCDVSIRNSWPAIRRLANTASGRSFLNKQFQLCNDSLIVNGTGVDNLVSWLNSAWSYLAMIDYPYPTNFLNPVPGWPVKVACSYLSNLNVTDQQLITNIYKAVTVYANYSGQVSCFSINNQASSDLGISGWDFQSCTEMVMPMCQDGKTDMFEPLPWNFTQFKQGCAKDFFGVQPRQNWAMINYGSKLKWASNIIFSNGYLDPWIGGGVIRTKNSRIVTILIKDGAHHYDLRPKSPKDTASVKKARVIETITIRKWLTAYRNNYYMPSKKGSNPGDTASVTAARNQEKAIIHQWVSGVDTRCSTTNSSANVVLLPCYVTFILALIVTLVCKF